VSFASTVIVVGTLFADDVALDRPVGAASVLDVRGIATVTATAITRLPVRVTSTSAASLHTFNGVTFASMNAADVQLYLELPGGVNFSLIMPDMSFDSPTFTSSGAHLQTVRGAGGLSENFVVELTNPSPTSTNAVF
jgi:hypothetical protein